MKLGVLVEAGEETRVAIVPNSVPKLMKLGFEVLVESGAGVSAHHLDAEYESKGASIVGRDDAMACEMLICIGATDFRLSQKVRWWLVSPILSAILSVSSKPWMPRSRS